MPVIRFDADEWRKMRIALSDKDAAIQELVEALEEIAWSNNSQWKSDRAKYALAKHKEKEG